MKPAINHFHSKGFLSVIYLDDCLPFWKSFKQFRDNITETVKLLEYLGFVINYDKSK